MVEDSGEFINLGDLRAGSISPSVGRRYRHPLCAFGRGLPAAEKYPGPSSPKLLVTKRVSISSRRLR